MSSSRLSAPSPSLSPPLQRVEHNERSSTTHYTRLDDSLDAQRYSLRETGPASSFDASSSSPWSRDRFHETDERESSFSASAAPRWESLYASTTAPPAYGNSSSGGGGGGGVSSRVASSDRVLECLCCTCCCSMCTQQSLWGRVLLFLMLPIRYVLVFLRTLVSGDKVRTRQYGVDLDLTYIEPNLIAMAFPALGAPSMWRNSLRDVRYLLERNHGINLFKIFNLSEIPYDVSEFGGKNTVVERGFPDHHSPPMDLLYEICEEIDCYLRDPFDNAGNPISKEERDQKAVSIHCLAGRGRTGTVIAAYMVFSGLFDSGSDALDHFAEKRSKIDRGVAQPSQRRYVHYFGEMVSGREPVRRWRRFKAAILYTVPNFDGKGGCRPIFEVRTAPTQMRASQLLYTTDPRYENDSYTLREPWKRNSAALPRGYVAADGQVEFSINVLLPPLADVYIRCFHVRGNGKLKKMFRFGFNSGFIASGVLRFTRQEIDDACKDKKGRFGKDFFMDLTFEDEEDHDINMYNHISRISELTVGALLSRREFLRSQGIRSRNVVQVEDEEVSSDSVLSRPRPRSTVNVFSTSGWNSDDARTIPGGSLSRLSVDSALR